MHHQRLVLNGPAPAVARLARALRAAGAQEVARAGETPVRMVWTTADARALAALCAGHRSVVVGVERFETLGTSVERLVVCGRETTLLARHALVEEDELVELPDDAGAARGWYAPGPDGARERAALDRAALAVGALPVVLGLGLAGTALDDALLVGPAIARLCTAAGDPLAGDGPPPGALTAIAELAAIGLTVGANATAPSCDAELAFERAWRLAQATAFAAREAWWEQPEDADWPDWLMFLLSCAAGVIEACAACLHRAPPDVKSVHVEHHATADEQLEHAAGLLAMVGVQALALFG